ARSRSVGRRAHDRDDQPSRAARLRERRLREGPRSARHRHARGAPDPLLVDGPPADLRQRLRARDAARGAAYHPNMSEHTIPVITLRGSYAEVGAAIGDACASTIERECDPTTWQ